MSPRAPADFQGFRPEALAFLRALERHNEKPWFEANRERYERELRAPLAALVEEVDVRLATLAPELVGDPKRSLFRIHRDVRFSNDKRPYKTNVAAWFPHVDAVRGGVSGAGTGTAAAHGGAGFWFELGVSGSSLGGGIWMPPRPTLARVREAIDEDHETLRAILDEPARRRRFGALSPEGRLTRMPRGFAEGHPAADLLRHQSFTLGRALGERELFGPRLADVLARDFARLLPLVRWLNSALGLRSMTRR